MELKSHIDKMKYENLNFPISICWASTNMTRARISDSVKSCFAHKPLPLQKSTSSLRNICLLSEDSNGTAAKKLKLCSNWNTRASICDLPDEVLLLIFSFLPQGLLRNCSQVCKRWHAVSLDESLRKVLKFGNGWGAEKICSIPKIIRSLRNCKKLETFQYYSGQRIAASILEVLSENCPKLRTLELECKGLPLKSVDALVRGCSMITHLCLYNIGGKDFTNYLPLASLSKIKILELYNCQWVSSEFLCSLEAKYTRLIEFTLKVKVSFDDIPLVEINNNSLSSLKIYMLRVSDKILERIVGCRRLRTLELSQVPYTTSASTSLEHFLAEVDNLRCLNLQMNRCYSSLPLNHLFENAQLHQLTRAVFSDCTFNNQDLALLAQRATMLRSLTLNDCYSFENALSKFLLCAKNLTELVLTDMKFLTGDFVRELNTDSALRVLRVEGESDYDEEHLAWLRNSARKFLFLSEEDEKFVMFRHYAGSFPDVQQSRFNITYDEVWGEEKFPSDDINRKPLLM